jgi:hypothetical protein
MAMHRGYQALLKSGEDVDSAWRWCRNVSRFRIFTHQQKHFFERPLLEAGRSVVEQLAG